MLGLGGSEPQFPAERAARCDPFPRGAGRRSSAALPGAEWVGSSALGAASAVPRSAEGTGLRGAAIPHGPRREAEEWPGRAGTCPVPPEGTRLLAAPCTSSDCHGRAWGRFPPLLAFLAPRGWTLGLRAPLFSPVCP